MIKRKVAINYIKDLEQTMHSDKAIAKVLPLQIFIKQKNIIKISIKILNVTHKNSEIVQIMILVQLIIKRYPKLFSDIFLLCLITRITFNILYQRELSFLYTKIAVPTGDYIFLYIFVTLKTI